MSDTKKQIRAIYDGLQEEKEALTAKSAPLRAAYEDLYQKIHPMEAAAQELARQIKAIEQPRMGQINEELSGLTRVLGGKRLSDGGAEE